MEPPSTGQSGLNSRLWAWAEVAVEVPDVVAAAAGIHDHRQLVRVEKNLGAAGVLVAVQVLHGVGVEGQAALPEDGSAALRAHLAGPGGAWEVDEGGGPAEVRFGVQGVGIRDRRRMAVGGTHLPEPGVLILHALLQAGDQGEAVAL